MTDTSAEAAKKRAEEQLSTAMAGMVTAGNENVVDEAEAEAEAKRQEKRAQEQAAAKVIFFKSSYREPSCCPTASEQLACSMRYE